MLCKDSQGISCQPVDVFAERYLQRIKSYFSACDSAETTSGSKPEGLDASTDASLLTPGPGSKSAGDEQTSYVEYATVQIDEVLQDVDQITPGVPTTPLAQDP